MYDPESGLPIKPARKSTPERKTKPYSNARNQRQKSNDNRGSGANPFGSFGEQLLDGMRQREARYTGGQSKARVPKYPPNYANQEIRLNALANGQIYGSLPNDLNKTSGYKPPKNEEEDTREILPPSETVTNAKGVVQTFKKLSGGGAPIDMNRTFAALQNDVYGGAFSSNQLPTTQTNPFARTQAVTPGFYTNQGDFGGANAVNFDREGGIAAMNAFEKQDNRQFDANAEQIYGASERIVDIPGGMKSGRLLDALNSVKSEVKDTPERRALQEKYAFLGEGDSMQGIKARDAAQGRVYAGGNYYIAGEKDDSPAVKINSDQARDMSAGRVTASELLSAHIEKNKANTAAAKQSPLVIEEQANKQAFKQDKPMLQGNTGLINGATDFFNNNSEATPKFGASNSYEAMNKYKKPDFKNPFG